MLVVDAVSVARYRRIDQIGEQDRQSPDLTSVTRGGEQILGLGVAPIDREHLIGQRRRCHPIATVNRRHRTIQQLINRRNPTDAHGQYRVTASSPYVPYRWRSARATRLRSAPLSGVPGGHPYAAAVVLAAVSPVSAWLLTPNAPAP
jgi:hypothetical protein